MPVDISQLNALAAELNSSNGRVGRDTAKVVRSTAEKVKAGASQLAHQGPTGDLKASFKVTTKGSGRVGGIAATVASDLRYSGFQEFGTSKNPPNPALTLAAESQEQPFADALEAAAANSLGL